MLCVVKTSLFIATISDHGLIGLSKVVAKEGAKHGVRANVVCPGFVRTPLVEKQIPEQAKELMERAKLKSKPTAHQ